METEKKELEIIDTDISGRGIGRYNGKAVFVQGAVTGDIVLYETEASKKRYDIGKLCHIISPSHHRRNPECLSFGECGGCTFLHIDRELELDIKRRAVESAFRRAGIGNVKVSNMIHGNSRQYRNKAVFHLNENGSYGFFTSESHSCSDCESCLLVPTVFNEIKKYTEDHFKKFPIGTPPKNIMLRIGNGDVMLSVQVDSFGQCADFLTAICKDIPCIKSAFECIGYPTSYDAKFKLFRGDMSIQTDFAKLCFNISPNSFFQVNTEIAELICKEIAGNLSPQKGDTILDLYCGIGTIGLTVAKEFRSANIIGVEINESAVADAKKNSILSNISNVRFICSDAGHVDFTDSPPYAVIVDPPRYGLTSSMISSIEKIHPEKLIYMSCNPSTLAGDSLKFTSGGYSISECIAADMFPGCPHVESVVVFSRQ